MFSRGDDDALMDFYRKNAILIFRYLQRKCKIYWKKLLKNLVGSEKSSTFAPDLRLRLANLKKGKNCTEKS